MRSRRLLFAPLALAVLASVATGCTADEPSPARAADTTVVPATDSRPDVSTVDWRNATYSVACRALGGPSDQQVPVTLTNGTGTTEPVSWFGPPTRITVTADDVLLGDLTGDGRAEAVVRLTCSPEQSNGQADEVQVFGPGSELLATPTVPNRAGSDFAPAIRSLQVADGRITGTAFQWAASDPHCCPSSTEPFTFTWDASRSTFTAS